MYAITKRERQVAWTGLIAGGLLALAFAGSYLLRWPIHAWWQPWAAFWSLAGGFTVFYAAGCFGVWADKRHEERVWLAHQYWLNGLGCFVGWVAVALLWKKYRTAGLVGNEWTDFLLAVVAFLGLVGHLPFAATGLAVALRNIAMKALGAA
jgi:hypothetical protein